MFFLPRFPQGQRFIASISWKLAGYLNNLKLALEIEIDLSSIGSRKDCKMDFLNSKASSRNNTPLWARDTSPGKGLGPLQLFLLYWQYGEDF